MKKQTKIMSTFEAVSENPYGQFIILNDQNEISYYSPNGTAIYYSEDPHESLITNDQEDKSLPKYKDSSKIKSNNYHDTIQFVNNTLIIIFSMIVCCSFYLLFLL